MSPVNPYTIRQATRDDEPAVRRIAALDSQRPLPAGPVLVGEIDGGVEAAISLADGRVAANPFVRTAELRSLLLQSRGDTLVHRRRAWITGRARTPATAA